MNDSKYFKTLSLLLHMTILTFLSSGIGFSTSFASPSTERQIKSLSEKSGSSRESWDTTSQTEKLLQFVRTEKQTSNHSQSAPTDDQVLPTGDSKELSTWQKMLTGYVLFSGILGLAIVRPPLIRWYKSQTFLIGGKGPVDILLKQVGYRLGFEIFVYALSCIVGAAGGWIYVLLRAGKASSSQ
jgi:hypothetical protein